ncbi:C4-dicarboxylate transporter, partial [Rhodococcus wratislaviensis IFP 2016]
VPGSSFLALSATATALGIFPVAAVAVLLGADRIMDSMRVFVNLLGNCVATFVVSNWEGQLDKQKMQDAIHGKLGPGGADPVEQPPVVAEYESRQ